MKYCEHVAHSLCFNLYDVIPCCTCNNGNAPKYYDIRLHKEDIFYNLNFENTQKEIFEKLNSEELKNFSCANCIFLKEKEKGFNKEDKINSIFLKHWTECNCDCVYCDNTREKMYGEAAKYNPYHLIKKLYEENKIDAENLVVRVQGGDLSVLPDFEDYMNLFEKNGYKEIHFSTNNISYQTKIEQILKKNKGSLNVSLDCGSKEAYKKIKQVDCFNIVINNLKKYITAKGNSDHITIHYIIVKEYNDSKKEIAKFINLMQEIGIKNIGIRIDHKDLDIYLGENNSTTSVKHYQKLINFFYKKATDFDFKIDGDVCIEQNFVLKNFKEEKSFIQKLLRL